MKYFILIITLFLSCSSQGEEVQIKGSQLPSPREISLQLHLPKHPNEIAWGLMNVLSLQENEGMLFAFKNTKKLCFWMFNCYIDLDIAFLDNMMIIREFNELIAYPDKMDPARPIHSLEDINRLYPPNDPIVQFFSQKSAQSKGSYSNALELPHHFFNEKGVKVGWSLSSDENQNAYLIAPVEFTKAPENKIAWCLINPGNSLITYLIPENNKEYSLYEISDANIVLKSHNFLTSPLKDKTNGLFFIKKMSQTSILLYIPKQANPKAPTLKQGDHISFIRNFS